MASFCAGCCTPSANKSHVHNKNKELLPGRFLAEQECSGQPGIDIRLVNDGLNLYEGLHSILCCLHSIVQEDEMLKCWSGPVRDAFKLKLEFPTSLLINLPPTAGHGDTLFLFSP